MADTVELMRKRVLDMAIRGNLVEKYPEDGTGTELYRDIVQEKDSLMKSGKIKQEKKLPLVSKEEEPFEIPINWMWVRLGSLTAAEDDSFSDGPFGSNLKTIHYTENPEVRIIQLNNVGEGYWKDKGKKYTTYQHAEVLKRYNIKPGDMVIAKMMPAGRTIIVPEIEERYIVSSDNVKFVPNKKINSRYIMHAINSPTIRQMIADNSTGTTRVRTSSSKLKNLLVPLPSLAEQKRIVAKIEEIFAVIDQIDTKKEEALSIIHNMRQTALQDAIMGILVDQDENEEAASDLYEKIQAEKEQMVKEKKIKKEKPLPKIEENEIPFDIPASWKWVRLGNIGDWGAGATPARGNSVYWEGGTIPWLKTGELNNSEVYSSEEFITEEAVKKTSVRLNKPGDILIAMYGATIGKLGILQFESTTNQACCACTPFTGVYNKYLFYFLMSNKENFIKSSEGGAQPNISKTKIVNTLAPLPPLAEQERIVEKIDTIMDICDQMEAILDGTLEANEALKVAE